MTVKLKRDGGQSRKRKQVAKADDYDVGYCKPPKHAQFKPGHSGNPKGRPKGAQNLRNALREELHDRIAIKESGRTKRLTKQEAMLKVLMEKALKGDLKAIQTLISISIKLLPPPEPEAAEDYEMSATDYEILDSFLTKTRATNRTKPKGA